MAYIVVNSQNKNSHFNILVDAMNKARVFTPTSALYRCLSSNFDVVENITRRVSKMQRQDVVKAIQLKGREENKKLRTAAFRVFDELGWDQPRFYVGYDFIYESYYERIPEDIKFQYADVIEEAFHTTTNRWDFYQFVREHVEGNLKAKHHMMELLQDMLLGIRIQDQLFS